MNSLSVVVFAVALALASAGVIHHTVDIPVAKSTVLQGPSTSTHVIGPDGSQIVASAPGGVVNTVETVAEQVVAYSAPVVAAPVAYAAAPVAYAAHHAVAPVAYAGHVAHHAVAPVAYAAAPAAYAAVAPVAAYAAYAPAPVAYAAGPVAYAYPAGHGVEGQYVHDFTEKLYDDGAYKGEAIY